MAPYHRDHRGGLRSGLLPKVFLRQGLDRPGRQSIACVPLGACIPGSRPFDQKEAVSLVRFIHYGGGIAILYFATYAAFQIYRLLPQGLAFSIMVLITILACGTAIAYQTQALAVLGLIGGFITPILMSSGKDHYLILFTYMTILNVGVLAISFRKRWGILQALGFAVTYLIYTLWYMDRYDPQKFWPASSF